ncbi:MAG: hypothetical protein ACLFV3_03870 [Phycisphaeraceae bacterium]
MSADHPFRPSQDHIDTEQVLLLVQELEGRLGQLKSLQRANDQDLRHLHEMISDLHREKQAVAELRRSLDRERKELDRQRRELAEQRDALRPERSAAGR